MQKVTLVTGASRGIGAETARLAAQSGYAVCINYHQSESKARELLDELQASGASAIAVRADIADESDVKQLFEAIDSQLGPLTALVNNAGILEQQCDFENISLQRLQLLCVCEPYADAQQLQKLLSESSEAFIVYNQHQDAIDLIEGLAASPTQVFIEIRQDTKGVLGLHAIRKTQGRQETLELIYQ